MGGLKRGNITSKTRLKREILQGSGYQGAAPMEGVAPGSRVTLLGGPTLRSHDPIDPSHHQQVRPPAQIVNFYFRIACVSNGTYDDNHCIIVYQ